MARSKTKGIRNVKPYSFSLEAHEAEAINSHVAWIAREYGWSVSRSEMISIALDVWGAWRRLVQGSAKMSPETIATMKRHVRCGGIDALREDYGHLFPFDPPEIADAAVIEMDRVRAQVFAIMGLESKEEVARLEALHAHRGPVRAEVFDRFVEQQRAKAEVFARRGFQTAGRAELESAFAHKGPVSPKAVTEFEQLLADVRKKSED